MSLHSKYMVELVIRMSLYSKKWYNLSFRMTLYSRYKVELVILNVTAQ